MRGISPVIATVIILAVTIAIAVAVIGWITGLFGATTGGTEQLQIMPDSYIKGNLLHLHIINRGSDVTIYKISVDGLGTATSWTTSTSDVTSVSSFTTGDIVIKAGEDVWIIANVTNSAVAGTTYTVKVYTKNGNVFTASVTAKS